VWASYSLLTVLRIFQPLKMMPLVLLESTYKSIWLAVVAYPLWSRDQLMGSPAEDMTYAFLWVLLPIVAMPWKYAFTTYVRGRQAEAPTGPTPAAGQRQPRRMPNPRSTDVGHGVPVWQRSNAL
jgi:hypothetical protein